MQLFYFDVQFLVSNNTNSWPLGPCTTGFNASACVRQILLRGRRVLRQGHQLGQAITGLGGLPSRDHPGYMSQHHRGIYE